MKYFIPLLLLVTFISCTDDSDPVVYQTEEDIIQYLEDQEISANRTEAGLYYNITKNGTGKLPTAESKVTFSYTFYLLNGAIIEQSDPEGIEVTLSQLIPGLAEGFTYFDEGSEGTLFIHPLLGYGYVNQSNVPAGSVLIFDVKILKITNPEDEILAYLSANNIEAEKTETGLFYTIEEEGTGAQITETSIATIIYEGYYLDDKTFDTSNGIGVQFNLKNVIPGFSEGLSFFKEGGKGTIFLPPSLAYGISGTTNIPGNSVLIFDIEVISVDN